MSIPQLNANSRMAADNETMYQLTRDRHILGSNQTRKLVNENELQTHVAKMQQIANLTDVLYETEQKSSSQFYENVVYHRYK